LLPFAPWAAVVPTAAQWPLIAGAALFAAVSLLLLSWSYARAQAQILVATEYTGFIWLALLGWWFFGEELTVTALAGAGLIVAGCLLAVRQPAKEPQEAML
jgi:S-adenosylmethionine uptake transporter